MTKSSFFSKFFRKETLLDIRFWIGFFVVIRLIGIANAPLEIGHNWRQSLTSMIARNFYEHGANLLYPMIDLAGEKSGIIGSEFPLFNWLIYAVSKVFGYTHWYGRPINMLVTGIGVFYFYKILKEVINKKVAFFSAFLLSTSVWFGFGRKIMPDTFSVALVIVGLYFAYRYTKDTRAKNAILYFIFCTLGILVKIPALSLFSVLGIVLFLKEIPIKRKVVLFALGAVSFGIVCTWYFYWVPHLVSTYGYELYFPRTFSEGFKEVMGLLPEMLEKFYFVAFSSFVGFACFLGGVYYMVVIPENSLIVINGSPSPQHIYFAHRKGWTETSEVLKSGNFIDSVARLGADYLIWDKVKADPPKGLKNVVFEDTDYLIFNISKKKL